jgi:hypothetical protein
VLCSPSPEFPFRFIWALGWSTWYLALDPSSVLYLQHKLCSYHAQGIKGDNIADQKKGKKDARHRSKWRVGIEATRIHQGFCVLTRLRGEGIPTHSAAAERREQSLDSRIFPVGTPTNRQTAAPRPPASPDLSPVTRTWENQVIAGRQRTADSRQHAQASLNIWWPARSSALLVTSRGMAGYSLGYT